MEKNDLHRIAFVGDYIPRQCGIATFTADLCEAIASVIPNEQCFVGAVNDRPGGYAYSPRVRFEIEQEEIDSYRRAADFLNINNVEVACVQHEFGIYGGKAGNHLLTLLRDLNMPIVTTLHTVLKDPNESQRRVMEQLMQLSDRVVVMAERGHDFLREIYNVPERKIDVIPHGIPDIPFIDPNFYKDQFGVEGKKVLLTFGLMGRSKGLEHVIEALPAILEKHPDVVYIVLGATHPALIQHEGESYRIGLERLAEAKGVKRNVIFYNRFVTIDELKEFIGAADIYLTPYLNEAQITSGTLAYTFGAGKAVISTPYWYAQELLADDRGILVPFSNSGAIAEAVMRLLDNPAQCNTMRKNAYLLGREMIWPEVAKRYVESFMKARAGRTFLPRKAFAKQTLENRPYQLPPFKLDHLWSLSDSTGILQHAIFNVPNYQEGYCTDDNARAFILTVLLEELGGKLAEKIDPLATSSLAFLWAAFNAETGRFRNFMSYSREWLEEKGSEDSHSRALWALGTAIGRSQNQNYRNLCGLLFEKALPAVLEFTSPRAWAFVLIAIHEYLRAFAGDRMVNTTREMLAGKLVAHYKHNATPDWQWFEPVATYDNAKLSHALILTGYWTSQPEILKIGLTSLKWLVKIQTSEGGCHSPIGSNGFYKKGGKKARYDQQPVEAQSMLSACLEAFRITNDAFWSREAQRAFEWFLGYNDLGLPLYDSTTGGCRDALHSDRVNQNQGAESSLAFYLSLAELNLAQSIIPVIGTQTAA
ncbi:MAG: glycosyltransferase family 4 protein [Chthoniobacteraceae bacterium]